ncbi:hypothetical protein GYMLUDRAFT_252694 [Collybiopsis luxurians FD-317 M1]|uniref:Uncharacterized protein n=1 Tax=Collybiopsis luxurians FD-317 M1 TaxID=944289 RepID=A0A0D0B965_9AGAR|nr:hypothetical protein GYMLUDRAFT_252694 [Collybiopsis luxurians FD-317 M1]
MPERPEKRRRSEVDSMKAQLSTPQVLFCTNTTPALTIDPRLMLLRHSPKVPNVKLPLLREMTNTRLDNVFSEWHMTPTSNTSSTSSPTTATSSSVSSFSSDSANNLTEYKAFNMNLIPIGLPSTFPPQYVQCSESIPLFSEQIFPLARAVKQFVHNFMETREVGYMAAPLECQIRPEAQLNLVNHFSLVEIETSLAQHTPQYTNFACFLGADAKKAGRWYTQRMHVYWLKQELQAAIKDGCEFMIRRNYHYKIPDEFFCAGHTLPARSLLNPMLSLPEAQLLYTMVTAACRHFDETLCGVFSMILHRQFPDSEGLRYLVNNRFIDSLIPPLPCTKPFFWQHYIAKIGCSITPIDHHCPLSKNKGHSLLIELNALPQMTYKDFDYCTLKSLPGGDGVDVTPLVKHYCQWYNYEFKWYLTPEGNEPVIGAYAIDAQHHWLQPFRIHPPTPFPPPPTWTSSVCRNTDERPPVPAVEVSRKLSMLVEEKEKDRESTDIGERNTFDHFNLASGYYHRKIIDPSTKPNTQPSTAFIQPPLKSSHQLTKLPPISIAPISLPAKPLPTLRLPPAAVSRSVD